MSSHCLKAVCLTSANKEIKNNNAFRLNYLPLVAAIALALGSPAQAATYTVNNTDDAGTGSLRQAVIDANGFGGADNIVFDAALTGQKITLSTGQIEITDELVITGSVTGDATSITIDGDDQSRIFIGSNNAKITLENLTLTKGKEVSTREDYFSYDPKRQPHGGAIRTDGNLTLNNTTFHNNTSTSEYGGNYNTIFTTGDVTLTNSKVINNLSGGVGVVGDTVQVNASTISNNSRSGVNGTTVTINNSTISHNSRGIYARSSATINQSTISNNSQTGVSGSSGGVIIVNQSTISHNSQGITVSNSAVTLNQSTVSGNQGFGLFGRDSVITLNQSTITNNTQGGIHLYTYYFANSSSTLTTNNTILSGNSVENIKITKYTGYEDRLIIINATNSFFGDDETKLNGTNTDNVFNNSPNLSPLQANGGPTLTHYPIINSPVLNAGSNDKASTFTTDQRGNGFSRIYNNTVDIGAVEYKPFTWSINGTAQAKPLTDGLLALRYLFGFRGNALIDNTIDSDATLITANEIQIQIQRGIEDGTLDIDGNGEFTPLTDGLLVLRYLFGFRGDSLINNAIGNGASRTSASNIEAYLLSKMP